MSFLHRVSQFTKISFTSSILAGAIHQSCTCNPLVLKVIMVSCGSLFPLSVVQHVRLRIQGVSNSEIFCRKTGPCFWLKIYYFLSVLPTRTNLFNMHCWYFCTGIVSSLDSFFGILGAFSWWYAISHVFLHFFESDDCVIVRILKFEVMEYHSSHLWISKHIRGAMLSNFRSLLMLSLSALLHSICLFVKWRISIES